jgi:hypothetical protein
MSAAATRLRCERGPAQCYRCHIGCGTKAAAVEVVGAIARRRGGKEASDGRPERVARACCSLAELRPALGEQLLD